MNLYYDLWMAENCNDTVEYIETDPTLRAYEKRLDLPSGFLFDAMLDFDYEESLTNTNRSLTENITFTIVSVWRSNRHPTDVNQIIRQIKQCYPNSYIGN